MGKSVISVIVVLCFVLALDAWAQQSQTSQQPQAQTQQSQDQQMSQPQSQGQQSGAAQQQAQQQPSKQQAGDLLRANEIKGMQVRNQKGETLGTVDDAVINTKTGQVEHVIISSGGIGGFGGKTYPIPIQAFQLTTDRRLVLNMSKDQLDKAPTLAKNEWPPADEQQWAQRIKTYYSQLIAGARQQQQASSGPSQTQPSGTQATPMGAGQQ